MKNYTDLNICKVVYISEFYHMPNSLFHLLNVFDFIFNSVTCATRINQKLMKLTIHRAKCNLVVLYNEQESQNV